MGEGDKTKSTETKSVTHTVDKLLLSAGKDTTEVGTVLSAVFLCIFPGVSVSEIPMGWNNGSSEEDTYYAARQI